MQLTLIRHAKSDWGDPELSDFQRPLNKRGRRDAPEMGRRLAAADWLPDAMFVSTAVRARQTAAEIAVAVELDDEAQHFRDALYLASPQTMLQTVVDGAGRGDTHVAVVAHNPGTTQLAERLSGESFGNIPTCGVVTLAFDVSDWQAVAAGTGRVVHYDYPKNRASG